MRIVVLMVLAFGLVASGKQENTLLLTGVGSYVDYAHPDKYRLLNAGYLDGEAQISSYTSKGQLYGDEAGSFTLTVGDIYGAVSPLQLELSVSKLFSDTENRGHFAVHDSSGKLIGAGVCADMERIKRGSEYFLRYEHFIYLNSLKIRTCEMDFRNDKGKHYRIEKIFDKDSGELLLIDIFVDDGGYEEVNYEVLTRAGRGMQVACGTNTGDCQKDDSNVIDIYGQRQ